MAPKNGKPSQRLSALPLMYLTVSLLLSFTMPAAFAQTGIGPGGGGGSDQGGIPTWVEYGKRIEATQRISALENGFAGEEVGLYDGATSFSVTDIDVPGNFALPVRLARRIEIKLQPQDGIQPYDSLLHGVGNWEVDVPYMAATYPTDTGWNSDRCSTGSVPPPAMGGNGVFWRAEVWQGIVVHVPGRGDASALGLDTQTPTPSSGGPYHLTTTNRDVFDCIPMKSGLSGEGFRMTTAAGVQYYFDVGTTRTASKLVKYVYISDLGPSKTAVFLERNRYYLLASKIEDRFGNTVQIQYDASGHPTSISASDGRAIALTYSGGQLASATTNGRTWQYQYDASGNLTTVVLPDNSRWRYAYTGTLMPSAPPPYESLPLPWCQGVTSIIDDVFTLTATHPSGATAAFQFTNLRHYRSGVHASECVSEGDPANPTYDLLVPYFFDVMSLTQKTLSGPGMPTATWQYAYSSTPPGLWGSHDQPPNYPCTTCTPYETTIVTNPDGTEQHYRFGMVYQLNDGRLLQTDTLQADGSVIRTKASTYLADAAADSQPFYAQYGHVLGGVADPITAQIRPVTQTTITQDGATFTTTVNTFDAFARVATQTESSSLGFSRTDATSYSDNTNKWVLGQVAQHAVNGITAVSTTYDAATALPLTYSAFGKLQQTLTWNADGTLATVKDGNNHVTTASNWKRGIPQSIHYPDDTSQSATVNDDGWITSVTDEHSVTDENVFITNYGYDAMGRLASITYPTGDDVAWNQTLLSFAPVSGSEYGIPAGHWKQTVHTGNGYAVTYFDAMWRPLITDHYDSGSPDATRSRTIEGYDVDGRKVFTSYQTNQAIAYPATLPGDCSSWFNTLPGVCIASYDALNRITKVVQDSELGSLPTTTQYQAGFKTFVTDPRGFSTTTSYQAFGEPDTSQPVSIAMPEGATITILRDPFGKPLSIKRSGTYGGSTVSAIQSFVYDGNQLLCKRIEPETGATLFAYDGADNLAWSAPGTSLTSNTCDRGSVTSSQTITRGYDARNRLLSIAYPDGISNTTYTYAADGAILSATNQNGGSTVKTVYTYDKRRLLTGEASSVPGTSTFAIGYGYDANGHLGSLSYPDSRIITLMPNALGQPTQAGSYATGVNYYPNGAIKQFSYGDGSLHSLTQNMRGLPERSLDSLGATPVLDNTSDYDSNGNVAAITDGLPNNVGNIDMSYDGLDRLKTATAPKMFAGGVASFTYDPLDNLRSAGVGNGNQYTYSYDPATNLLTSMVGSQTFDFGYDPRGNVTHSNAQAYTFDMANRLRAANGLESYLYDAAGRRARKTNTLAGTLTYYAYDKAGSLLYEWDPATMDSKDYIYLGGSLVAKVTKNQSVTMGHIDGVVTGSGDPYVAGWACSTGLDQSITVELFAGPSGGGGTRIGFYSANQSSEPAVAQACQASGTAYRFAIPLTSATRTQYANASIYMYADSPVGNGNNALAGSGSYSIPPPPSAPPAPASINVPTSSNNGNVTVSWSAVSGASSYVLQQQFNGGSWPQVYKGSATSKAFTGLSNGSYVYRAQACNDSGCGAYVTSGTLTVALIPSAPASISVPASSYSPSIAVSWSASANASNYVLEESVNGGGWGVAWNGSATGTTVTVSSSGTYRFQVSACGAGGCSGFTASSNTAVTLKPASAPSLSGPSSSNTGTFTLSWSTVAGATRYQLNQNLNGTVTTPYNANGTSWSSSNLGDGSYNYQVFACNAAGCSPGSTVITVKVSHIPAAPASVIAPTVAIVFNSYEIRWSAVSGATSYQMGQTNTAGGTVSTDYTGPGTSTTTSPAGPVNTYIWYAARACNASGCSAWTYAPKTYLEPEGGPIGPGPNTSSAGGNSP